MTRVRRHRKATGQSGPATRSAGTHTAECVPDSQLNDECVRVTRAASRAAQHAAAGKAAAAAAKHSQLPNICVRVTRAATRAAQHAAAEEAAAAAAARSKLPSVCVRVTRAASRAAAAAAAKRQQLPDLYMDLVLHILCLLPASYKAWAGRRVCKAAFREFRGCRRVNPACSALPTACIMEFLEQHRDDKRKQDRLMAAVASQGNLTLLQFLHQQGCDCSEAVCEAAARRDDLTILQWALAQDPPLSTRFFRNTCTAAASAGDLEMLQLLESHCCDDEWYDIGYEVNFEAAAEGHLHILQWLHEEFGLSDCTAEAAAPRGHLDVLRWLHTQEDCSHFFNEELSYNAAAGGELEILQWLRTLDPPCPWDERVIEAAASEGFMDVMQFALEQDPALWDPEAGYIAAKTGHLELLQMAAAQQPPLPFNKADCLRAARIAHQAEVVEWLESLPDDAV